MKTIGVEVNSEDEQEYTAVVNMELLISTYCEVYDDDLEEPIGLAVEDRLTTTLGMTTLLNPMCGLTPKVTASDMMNEVQYDNAQVEPICQVQDIMDEKTPAIHSSSGSNSSNGDGDDEILPCQVNINYNKAEAELIALKSYKKEKYTPQSSSQS